jgi:putative molybdopterin biosynthesis protein
MQAVAVDTGDPMPDGYDAVIMIEDVEKISGSEVEILKPATPWQHVRLVGEDIVATELILSENHTIRPADMAAMIASGHTTVMVRKACYLHPPTGTELVDPGSGLKGISSISIRPCLRPWQRSAAPAVRRNERMTPLFSNVHPRHAL